MLRFFLVGSPNCGKSSVFNLLSSRQAPVGNRAGVTVDVSSTLTRLSSGEPLFSLSDLPGIRSLSGGSPDERAAQAALFEEKPDALLFVLDSTDPRGQFPLLSSVLSLAKSLSLPLLLIFNFCDRLSSFPSSASLSSLLGIPSVALSARTREGLGDLRSAIRSFLRDAAFPTPAPAHVSPGCAGCSGSRSCGSALLSRILSALPPPVSEPEWCRFLDSLFQKPILAALIFIPLILLFVFAVFGPLGNALSDGVAALCLSPLVSAVSFLLRASPVWLSSLFLDGILGGIGAILAFLPRLALLFLFRTFLEQSGILSRISRICDPFLRRCGLRGDAMIPLLLGFGCTVPAVLCTRGMKDRSAARRCAASLPLAVCSARLPFILLLCDCFFPRQRWWIPAAVWALSGFVFVGWSFLLSRVSKRREASELHEDRLPAWQLPTLRDLFRSVGEALSGFCSRAGGIILLTSALVWLLSHVSPRLFFLGVEAGSEESLLAYLGRGISVILSPLGFGDWRIASALLSGIGAKEATLSTLSVLLPGAGELADRVLLSGILSPRGAISLLVFYCFYLPCGATFAVQRSERIPLWLSLLPLPFAYLLSFLVFSVI